MSESDLPPECLDDDPPQHCYEIQAEPETLPDTGSALDLVVALAVVMLVMALLLMSVTRGATDA